MRRLIACGAVLLIGAFVMAQDGPLTDGANLPVRTDSNGYLLLAAQTYSGPDGPRRPLANTLVRTDANGYLIVTNPSGIGAPTDAQYWVGAAHAGLSAEKNLGALSTGLVINTAGVPSAYGGSSCTNQFVRSLNASGSATCNSVALASDVTGTLPPGNIYTEATVTTTGNIDDLSFSNANIIRMNNASDATIRGLAAGAAGQIVSIVSIGAGHVFLAHQNTNSTAENRLINAATSGDTPLAAGVGAATYQYDGTTQRWRLIAHSQGAWITRTFDAGNFTASTGNWTVGSGDILSDKYMLVGRQLVWQFSYNTTTVSATPAELRSTVPNGLVIDGRNMAFIRQSENGNVTFTLGFALGTDGLTYLSLFTTVNQASWATTTNATLAEGAIQLAVD